LKNVKNSVAPKGRTVGRGRFLHRLKETREGGRKKGNSSLAVMVGSEKENGSEEEGRGAMEEGKQKSRASKRRRINVWGLPISNNMPINESEKMRTKEASLEKKGEKSAKKKEEQIILSEKCEKELVGSWSERSSFPIVGRRFREILSGERGVLLRLKEGKGMRK